MNIEPYPLKPGRGAPQVTRKKYVATIVCHSNCRADGDVGRGFSPPLRGRGLKPRPRGPVRGLVVPGDFDPPRGGRLA